MGIEKAHGLDCVDQTVDSVLGRLLKLSSEVTFVEKDCDVGVACVNRFVDS